MKTNLNYVILAILASGMMGIVYAVIVGTTITDNYITTPTLNATTINGNHIYVNGTAVSITPGVKVTQITLNPNTAAKVLYGPVKANFIVVIISGSPNTNGKTIDLEMQIPDGTYISFDQTSILIRTIQIVGVDSWSNTYTSGGPLALPTNWQVTLLNGPTGSSETDYLTILQF